MPIAFHPRTQSNDAFLAQKAVAFDGTAGNGAIGTVNVFTVTGDVLVRVFAVCTEDLVSAGAGTMVLGISGNTNTFIASTNATDIDANEAWTDATPTTGEVLATQHKILANGPDIILTIATGDVTDGTLTFYALWRPLSAGASVAAA